MKTESLITEEDFEVLDFEETSIETDETDSTLDEQERLQKLKRKDRGANKRIETKEKNKKRKKQVRYEEYLNETIIEAGIKEGEIFRSKLEKDKEYFVRINEERKIYIKTDLDKNRSIEGDIVAVKITNKEKSEGKVVRIIKSELFKLDIIGKITILNQNDTHYVFQPLDFRFPKMIFNKKDLKENEISEIKEYEKDKSTEILYIAAFLKRSAESKLPFGRIKRRVGKSNEFTTEIEKVLLMNNIKTRNSFNSKTINEAQTLVSNFEEEIMKELEKGRLDLRDEMIFTIDPKDSLDLDDAISIKILNNEKFQIGVHIADVSHFIQEGTLLDDAGKERLSSIYLPQETISVFPKVLADDLMSLLPGKDRFSYSIIFNININNGNIDNEVAFKKTLINSKFKFSYDEVERILNKDFEENEKLAAVADKLNSLYELSKVLKEKRTNDLDNLNKVYLLNSNDEKKKLKYTFNKEKNHIDGVQFQDCQKSYSLVEEIMILANAIVAKRIHSYNDENSNLFRNNKSPDLKEMVNLDDFVKKYNNEELLNFALKKKYKKLLNNAYYISSNNKDDLYHYGLNLNYYCHFTSPIRRYQDILIHRILYYNEEKLNLINGEKKFFTAELLDQLNQNMSLMKRVKKDLDNLYFDNYFKNNDKQIQFENTLITEVFEKSLKVYFKSFDIERKITFKEIDEFDKELFSNHASFNVTFNADSKRFIFQKC